jgi:hypothetical protein
MKLLEIKTWVNSLPEEFMDFEVMNAEEGDFEDKSHTYYRLNKPIEVLVVMREDKEVLFMNTKPRNYKQDAK